MNTDDITRESIIKLDNEITSAVDSMNREPDSRTYEKIVSMLSEMNTLLDNCRKNGTDVSDIKNINTQDIRKDIDRLMSRAGMMSSYNNAVKLDEEISALMVRIYREADINTCDRILSLLLEMENALSQCRASGSDLPDVKNTDTEKIRTEVENIKHKVKQALALSKAEKIDSEITNLLEHIEKEPDISSCNRLLSLADDMKESVILCRGLKVDIKDLKNTDTDRILENAGLMKKGLTECEDLQQELINTDKAIDEILHSDYINPDAVERFSELVSNQRVNFNEIRSYGLDPSDIVNKDIDRLMDLSEIYRNVLDTDDEITDRLGSAKNYNDYSIILDLCEKQKNNLKYFKYSSLNEPVLKNDDIDSCIRKVQEKQNRKSPKMRSRILIAVLCSLIVVIVIAIVLGTIISRSGKSVLPYELKSALGSDYNTVLSDLSSAGFTNVAVKDDKTGWIKDNTVLDISSETDMTVGEYYPSDTLISILYSSDGRSDATECLKDFQDKKYSDVVNDLNNAGFKNVETIEIVTDDISLDESISTIYVDSKQYNGGECFIYKDTPVKVEYYKCRISVGKTPKEFKKMQYYEAEEYLSGRGFSNITFVRADDMNYFFNNVLGIGIKEGQIKDITVDSDSSFNADDSYYPDVPIVITVHTYKDQGCEDITETQ